MAHTNNEGMEGSKDTRSISEDWEKPGDKFARRCGEDVAHTNSESRLETCESVGTIRSKRNTRDNVSGSSRESVAKIGRESIESELGRILDGISTRLDEHRWPEGLGPEQHDWEPPRVANGVENRVGRLKALGNAVNPHQIYPILAAIKAINDSLHPLLNI